MSAVPREHPPASPKPLSSDLVSQCVDPQGVLKPDQRSLEVGGRGARRDRETSVVETVGALMVIAQHLVDHRVRGSGSHLQVEVQIAAKAIDGVESSDRSPGAARKHDVAIGEDDVSLEERSGDVARFGPVEPVGDAAQGQIVELTAAIPPEILAQLPLG
jgi:hypothetical protein